MHVSVALTSIAIVASAVNLEAENGEATVVGKPGFSIGENYKAADYSQQYGEELPGADFNKQVYQF